MLLITAIFNFILSKKKKSPKRPQESNSDRGLTAVCVTDGAGSDGTFSFFHMMIGRRGGTLDHTTQDRRINLGGRSESIQAMLEEEQMAPKDTGTERRSWKERRLICLRRGEGPVERELKEIDSYCEPEPDTTSDTAPMITD